MVDTIASWEQRKKESYTRLTRRVHEQQQKLIQLKKLQVTPGTPEYQEVEEVICMLTDSIEKKQDALASFRKRYPQLLQQWKKND